MQLGRLNCSSPTAPDRITRTADRQTKPTPRHSAPPHHQRGKGATGDRGHSVRRSAHHHHERHARHQHSPHHDPPPASPASPSAHQPVSTSTRNDVDEWQGHACGNWIPQKVNNRAPDSLSCAPIRIRWAYQWLARIRSSLAAEERRWKPIRNPCFPPFSLASPRPGPGAGWAHPPGRGGRGRGPTFSRWGRKRVPGDERDGGKGCAVDLPFAAEG